MAMRSGKRAVQIGIDNLRDFTQASMRGQTYSSGAWLSTGRLPEEYKACLRAVQGPVYVIYSYATPIAWTRIPPQGDDKPVWQIPDVTYSATTNDHQHIVRVATEHEGFYQ